ncbi:MAG: O-acetyl-ADP-ribose deacetylase [Planctomycetota bacterium]
MKGSVQLVQGDITEQHVDAIVNAANSQLAGGGGVDGAIHRRGGPSIMEESRRRYPQGCPTGSAVVTAAGGLPARWVIHAVGPRWRGGSHQEESLLRSAYRASLEHGQALGAQSLAFPAISAGIYGYPAELAAEVSLTETVQMLHDSGYALEVRFCLFDPDLLRAFQRALDELR